MIYYYVVKIKYFKGGQSIIKIYRKSFLELGELFCFLETKHKDNYLLLSIEPVNYKCYQKYI